MGFSGIIKNKNQRKQKIKHNKNPNKNQRKTKNKKTKKEKKFRGVGRKRIPRNRVPTALRARLNHSPPGRERAAAVLHVRRSHWAARRLRPHHRRRGSAAGTVASGAREEGRGGGDNPSVVPFSPFYVSLSFEMRENLEYSFKKSNCPHPSEEYHHHLIQSIFAFEPSLSTTVDIHKHNSGMRLWPEFTVRIPFCFIQKVVNGRPKEKCLLN